MSGSKLAGLPTRLLPCLLAACAPSVQDSGESAAPKDTHGPSDTAPGDSAPPPDTAPDDTSPTGDTSDEIPDTPWDVGLVQYDGDAHFGDWDTNLANLTGWATEAVNRGADLVLLPEGSAYGYATRDETWCRPGETTAAGRACQDVSSVAEPVPGGPSTEWWTRFAAQHGVFVLYSVPEVDGDTFYNTLGIVGPDGYVGRYRKRALYYIDLAWASPGEEDFVLETPHARFGLLICMDGTYDGRYYDGYADLGADAILLSMDWDQDPTGRGAAATWFVDRAHNNDVDIYASDVSTWDGTGWYSPTREVRERYGLPDPAVGIDGVSVHPVDFR